MMKSNRSKSLWFGTLALAIVLVSLFSSHVSQAGNLQLEQNAEAGGLDILVIEETSISLDYSPLRTRYPAENWVVCRDSDPATYTCVGGEYLPLDPVNWDIVFVYDIYNDYDSNLLTDLVDFVTAGGSLFALVDGAVTGPGIDISATVNALLTAAGYATLPVPVPVDFSIGPVTQTPSHPTCGPDFPNHYGTGSYVNTADIPSGMNYLEYTPGQVNMLFGVTAQGGVLGISTEYYSGGGFYSPNGPSEEALDYIYRRMIGWLTISGKCAAGYVYLPAIVDP